MVASQDPARVLCVGTGALNGLPPPHSPGSATARHQRAAIPCCERVNSGIAKCCQKCLKEKLCFSLLNVIGNVYRLKHEPNSNHAGLGSPLRRATYQRGRFGNTVVLFWYDRKAESLRLA